MTLSTNLIIAPDIFVKPAGSPATPLSRISMTNAFVKGAGQGTKKKNTEHTVPVTVMPVFVGRKLEFSPHEHPVTVIDGSRAYDLREVGEEYTVYRTTHNASIELQVRNISDD